MKPVVVCKETTWKIALRKDSSMPNGLVQMRVMVVKSVKNPTVPKYQWNSVFWNKRLKFPFKNSKYNKVKLIPDKNMNKVMTYSI